MTKQEQLAALAEKIEACEKCGLYKEATKSVPGEGNAESKIVFIGEAPGFNEDLQGKPFVGNAGEFLSFLLAKVGLKRSEVFITNVVKHRPPANRDPSQQEIASCRVWLEKQLKIISPKVIVCLGRWSLASFLPKEKISDVHGKPFKMGKTIILPLYHPAAALRSAQTARELEEDFLLNRRLLSQPETADSLVATFAKTKSDNQPEGQGSLF